MKISSNMNAIMMVANMNKANNSAATAMERLSSGLKINSAGDNPAGLAIANKLNTRIKGIEQANNNAMDAISLVQTAEGALDEVHSMLNRIRELSVQSINASNGPEERESMQSEIEALIAEIQSISERTEFNGINILNNSEKIMVQIGSNAYENMEIDSKELNLGEVLSTFDEFTVLRLEDSGEIKKINDVLEGKSSNAEKVNNIANLINSLTATDLSKNDKAESLFEKIKNEVNSANDDEAKIRNIVSQIESAYENTKETFGDCKHSGHLLHLGYLFCFVYVW